MDLNGGKMREPGKGGEKGMVPMGKLLPAALLEDARGCNRMLVVYPGSEYTSEYSVQIRRAWNRKTLDIHAADNFRSAIEILESKYFSFGILVCARDIPKGIPEALLGELEHGLGRDLVKIALEANDSMRALVESGPNYEIYAAGKSAHAVPKMLENDAILTFQKLIIALAPSGAGEL